MHFNGDVDPQGMRPELILVFGVVSSFDTEVGVSAIVNGRHSEKSLNYTGAAIDLDAGGPQDNLFLSTHLIIRLPEVFDVVNHGTHVHVEYQPKLSDRA